MENQEQQAPGFESVEHLGNTVIEWFYNRHQQLDMLINAPEGIMTDIQDTETGELIPLQGDVRKAYLAGLAQAQEVFNNLPFKVITQDDQQDA